VRCGVLQDFQAEDLIYYNLMRKRQVDKHKHRLSAVGAAYFFGKSYIEIIGTSMHQIQA
jgi:hypothetical protein